ncbi:MAG: HD domain-containing protein [Candidatus Aenigmarchaeota archaeon]|nr:HD domain-containing protein [Candidatus Aenigmarchaeota archaeon]
MDDVIGFLLNAGKLKRVKRAGWVLRNVPDAESVAEHSFRTALICMMLGGVNRERCIKIALIHDLAEALVGDITPVDGVTKEEKHSREADAFDEILKSMDTNEIRALWNEYEENKTEEAELVHSSDKLELALQAYEYEKEYGNKINLEEFWRGAEPGIKNGRIMELFQELKRMRRE